ncbi:MAG TPA: VWA domain-containing protein [Vicinamibacterales bacterium]|jgi:VWFA-related protein|nr:VWA domain-containing protein [Vicinamibacterales bacterium]
MTAMLPQRWAIGATIGVAAAVAAAEQPVPRFRALADLVEVDAVVEDADGRFVSDLAIGDFEVLEDGKPQPLATFYLRVAEGRRYAAFVPVVPRASAGAARPRAVFVLLFDDEHLTPAGFTRVQTAAEQFLNDHFERGDLGGVVVNGAMAGNRLTSEREELVDAVHKAKPRTTQNARRMEMRDWPRLLNEYEAIRIAAGDRDAVEAAVTRGCTDDPDKCRGPGLCDTCGRDYVDGVVRTKARQVAIEARSAAERTLDTLTRLFAGLERLDGHKSVILLSEGFVAEDSWPLVRQVIALAARAHARIYSLDARGLNARTSDGATEAFTRSTADQYAALLGGVDVQSDAPNMLGVETGGFVVRNANTFGAGLARIARDASTFYVLGYKPVNEVLDGSYRKIDVKVKRPGLRVRARRGYIADARATVAAPVNAASRAPADDGMREPPRELLKRSESIVALPSPPAEAATGTLAVDAGAPATRSSAYRLRPGGTRSVERLMGTATVGASSETLASSDVAARAAEGWSAYQRGDVEGARQALAQAARDVAAPPWIHYALGQAEYALGQYEPAAHEWESVRQAVPEFEPAYFDLADAYLQSKDFGQALAVLRAAQKRWPSDTELLNAIGVIQVARGALDDAVATFGKAIDANTTDGLAMFNLAKTLELRYFRSRRYSALARAYVGTDRDLKRAREMYRQYLEIGGPFESSARDGLQRLEWAAAARDR